MILRNLCTKIIAHGCVVYNGVKGPAFFFYFIDKSLNTLLTGKIKGFECKFTVGVFCEELLALCFHLLGFFTACEEKLGIRKGLEKLKGKSFAKASICACDQYTKVLIYWLHILFRYVFFINFMCELYL